MEKALKRTWQKVQLILNWMVRISIVLSKKSLTALSIPSLIFNRVASFFKEVSRVIREAFTALIVATLGGLVAGILLSNMTGQIEALPGLLILIPGSIGMRGNIFGALGSRLSSQLHIGILSPELKRSDILNQNIISAMILTVVMSIFLAFMAKIFSLILGFESMGIVDFTVISVLGGIFSGVLMLPATILIALKSYENGWDPDNVTTPLITNAGDLFTLPAIILAVQILLWIRNGFFEVVLFLIFIAIGIIGVLIGLRGDLQLKKIVKQSIPTLLISSIFGTAAGTILTDRLHVVLQNPIVLTLVPMFSAQGGSLVSVLGARLSSGLHAGIVESSLKPAGQALVNFGIIFILAVMIYPTIGFLAHFAGVFIGIPSPGIEAMVLIGFLAGMILIPLIMIMAFYLSVISYKKGLDPDNIVIPLATSMTDPVATTSLVIVVLLILGAAV
jgi:mgtE-like transporter